MKSVRKMVLVPYTEGSQKLENKGLDRDLILTGIPKSLKRKAEALMRYIERLVCWKDNGEIVYNGKNLPGSHIADLLRYSLQEYGDSPPPQYDAFLEILGELNVPKSVISQRKNPFTKQQKKDGVWQKL